MEREILVGLLLGIQSYWDIKEQQIPLQVSFIGGMIGVLLSILTGRDIWDVILAVVPGFSLLIIGKVSKESIGYGDGIIISILGLYYSLEEVWEICFCAFLFSAGIALVLLVLWKKKGNETIPFIPFLLLGWFVNRWI